MTMSQVNPGTARAEPLAEGQRAPATGLGAATDDPPRDRSREALVHVARLGLVAGAYIVAGKLGLTLASVHPSATAIWPCTGIALAALLALGLRMWPAILVGAFAVNVSTAGSLVSSLGIATGNMLEALLGAWLIGRFAGGRQALDRAQSIFRFAGLAALACVASATFGVLSLVLTGFAPWERFGAIWLTWWLGDFGGALIVAPFLLVWSRRPRLPRRWPQLREAVALIACVLLVGWVVFHLVNPIRLAISLKFLCIPPLVWAAFRFGPRMVTGVILLLATQAVWGMLGRVGLSQPYELNASLLVVQVFLSVSTVTTLVLSAEVSERRRAARDERSTSERLREAVLQLETIGNTISHELRTPIGTVFNSLDVLREDYGALMSDGGVLALRRIQSAAVQSKQLLDELAQFVRPGSGPVDQQVVDMTALARDVYEEVASSLPETSGVRFELAELPPAVGSAALLARVFRNLFSNAVKFTRGRHARRIEVTGVRGVTENSYFVSDNGMGFDPADRETLFEPFRRLRGAEAIEGTGMGLAVVAWIVRRHDGRVWAESDGSSGARFGFTLHREGVLPERGATSAAARP